jgi:hypothetical protein
MGYERSTPPNGSDSNPPGAKPQCILIWAHLIRWTLQLVILFKWPVGYGGLICGMFRAPRRAASTASRRAPVAMLLKAALSRHVQTKPPGSARLLTGCQTTRSSGVAPIVIVK